MSSSELERQPLPENGAGEMEIHEKAQWETDLQKIIDDAPDKMQEEFEQNGQKQPWTELFRRHLSILKMTLDIGLVKGVIPTDQGAKIIKKYDTIMFDIASLEDTFVNQGMKVPTSYRRVLTDRFKSLLE